MIRYIVSGICVILCVSLQMGWKEISTSYKLNYRDYNNNNVSDILDSDDVYADNNKSEEKDMLHWTDLYGSLDMSPGSHIDLSSVSGLVNLITKESELMMSATQWHSIYNDSVYSVKSRAVRSNSISILENPIIHIRMEPLPCVSAKQLLEQVVMPGTVMSHFLPLFHLYDTKLLGKLSPINNCKDIDSNDGACRGSMSLTTIGNSSIEMWNIIAPLIWPLEERWA